ncbi:MAG TPA: ATP-binding cassette domain-containing protein [Acidimicrobiia bacterium]|nr:ATP-binding cassette domain-containing protein [Acidimicrobiia bacterium]
MTSPAAVEVEGLVKQFGNFTAVDHVSFTVQPGELFGFLGPNGAGKTTTISILCTLLQPSGGVARVAGHDVAREQAAVRSSIGLVFQEVTLDDYLTGAENLRFHAVLYGVPPSQVRDRTRPLLEMVGLADRADQQVRFYSGGMKRRLEIARGLLHAPRVLFLDEPTIGLDPQTRKHIWDYVDTLRARESTTMFLTTHYMDEAERCDRIAIIDHGRIVAIDTPDALKASVGADTVTVSTGDDEGASRALRAGLGLDTDVTDDGVRFRVVDGEGFVPRLFDHLPAGVRSVNVRRPSLDDVFMEYTGHDLRDADAGAADQFRMNAMVRGFRRG